MDGFEKPIGDLSASTKEYLDLKTDELKLKTAEGLSLAFSKFFGLMLSIMVLMIVLIAIAFGGVLLLGDWIGSYAAGAFIRCIPDRSGRSYISEGEAVSELICKTLYTDILWRKQNLSISALSSSCRKPECP